MLFSAAYGNDLFFYGIAEDGIAFVPFVHSLAVPKPKELSQLEFLGQLGQPRLPSNGGANLGQLAFGMAGVLLVDLVRDNDLNDGVAKELETLIVIEH